MSALTPAERARNRLAGLHRQRRPAAEIAAAREVLIEALIRARIAEVVERSPVTLTAEQRERIAAIFLAPGPLVPDEIRRVA